MEADRKRILNVDRLNDYEIIVEFSDRTTATISVEQLLAFAPARHDSGSDVPGT
jgi:hypothetical protein